jgi:hypothetical protein
LKQACLSAVNEAKWICPDWQTGKMMYAERGVGKGSLTFAEGFRHTLRARRSGIGPPHIARFDSAAGARIPW